MHGHPQYSTLKNSHFWSYTRIKIQRILNYRGFDWVSRKLPSCHFALLKLHSEALAWNIVSGAWPPSTQHCKKFKVLEFHAHQNSKDPPPRIWLSVKKLKFWSFTRIKFQRILNYHGFDWVSTLPHSRHFALLKFDLEAFAWNIVERWVHCHPQHRTWDYAVKSWPQTNAGSSTKADGTNCTNYITKTRSSFIRRDHHRKSLSNYFLSSWKLPFFSLCSH